MASDSRKHVEAWLRRQGYALEYHVARLLKAEGTLRIEQGRHWQDTDPRTGERKGRELDVVGTISGEKAIIRVVVECKHLIDPWVIFQHEEGHIGTSRSDTVDLWMASKPIRILLDQWYAGRPPWILSSPSGFKVVDTRFDRKLQPGEDGAFDASMALTRGAWALHQSTPRGMAALTIPVMVLSGALFTLSYDSAGHDKLADATRERAIFSAAVLEGPQDYVRPWPVIIDVVTTEALESFVDDLGPALRDMYETLEAKL